MQQQQFGAERRTTPRHPLIEPVVVEVPSWPELVALHTNDISAGGMFVRTDASPDRDTRVTVQLVLPDDSGTLELAGIVVHVVTAEQARAHGWIAGFGMQFSELTPERRRALQQLLEHARQLAAGVPTYDALQEIRDAFAPSRAAAEGYCASVPNPNPPAPGSPADLAERSRQIAAQLRRRAPAAAPTVRPGLVDEALRLVAEKRYAEAIERLELAMQRAPSLRLRVLLVVVQARLAMTERNFPRARTLYESVLELDPKNEMAQRELLILSALLSPEALA